MIIPKIDSYPLFEIIEDKAVPRMSDSLTGIIVGHYFIKCVVCWGERIIKDDFSFFGNRKQYTFNCYANNENEVKQILKDDLLYIINNYLIK